MFCFLIYHASLAVNNNNYTIQRSATNCHFYTLKCGDYWVVITRWTTGGYDIFITCPAKNMHREPAKSMHREPEGLEVHAVCGTGDETIMPTCREASN